MLIFLKTSTNDFEELMQKYLLKYLFTNMQIICPLSFGRIESVTLEDQVSGPSFRSIYEQHFWRTKLF